MINQDIERKKIMILEILGELKLKRQNLGDNFDKLKDDIPLKKNLYNILSIVQENQIEELYKKVQLLATYYDLNKEFSFPFSMIYKTVHIKIRKTLPKKAFITKKNKKVELNFHNYADKPEQRDGNVGFAKGKINIKNNTNEIIINKFALSSYFNPEIENKKTGKLRRNAKNETIIIKETQLKNIPPKFIGYEAKPIFDGKVKNIGRPGWRFKDSECKLLEYIANQIEIKIAEIFDNAEEIDLETVFGTIEIYTERAPCESCIDVMLDFSGRYKKITLEVIDNYGKQLTIQNGEIK